MHRGIAAVRYHVSVQIVVFARAVLGAALNRYAVCHKNSSLNKPSDGVSSSLKSLSSVIEFNFGGIISRSEVDVNFT